MSVAAEADRSFLVEGQVAIVSPEDYDFLVGLKWWWSDGYLYCKHGSMHKVVMERVSKPPTHKHVVDHINHKRNDNRRTNLRWLTQAENMRNLAPRGKTPYDTNRLSVRVSDGYLRDLKMFALLKNKTLTEVVIAAIEEYTAARDYRIAPQKATKEEE